MSSNALYGAVALFSAMAMALCGVGLMDSSEAAYDETSDIYELELAPGFSYTWTPTYPSDLDVTTTVEKYEEGVVAQMVGESVQITVADGTTSGTYDVLIKAYTNTAGIEQTIYKIIRVTVAAGLEVSGSINNIILGASVDFTPNASSGMTEVITWTSSDIESTGLTFQDGKVTGTPASAGTYSFTLTANAAGETKDLEISFIVYQKIVGGSDETITSYGTEVSSTGVTQTVSESDTSGDLNVVWTADKALPEEFTLDPETGTVSGSSSVAQFTEVTLTGTDSASGQSVSHKVTIRSEPALTIGGVSDVVVYSGCTPREVQMTFTENTSGITWSVTEAAGVSIDQSGKVTVTGDASAQDIIVTAQTAYGQSKQHTIHITVESLFEIAGDATLSAIAGQSNTATYTTTGDVTWSVDTEGIPAGANVSIDAETGVLTLNSASPQESFTVTITATSETGQTAEFEVTLTVVSQLSFTNEPSTGVIVFEI